MRPGLVDLRFGCYKSLFSIALASKLKPQYDHNILSRVYRHFLVLATVLDSIGVFVFLQLYFFFYFFYFFFFDIINSHYSLCIQWSLYFNYFLLFYNSCTIFCINIEVNFHVCFSSSVFVWNFYSGLVVSKIPEMTVTYKPKEKRIQCINCKKWLMNYIPLDK